MADSLKDQLLKAGLASRKQAKDIELEKRRNKKQGKPALSQEDRERAAAIEKARQEKVEKDRLLNERRQAEQSQRAVQAEIRQLAEQHRIQPPGNADIRYNFVWNGKVQSLWIDTALQKQLAAGTLTVVVANEAFLLVPADVAERIRQRDSAAVVQDHQAPGHPADDDAAYAEFPIPDDLHW